MAPHVEKLVSFPGLPHFYLAFAFTASKNKKMTKAWECLSREWKQDGRRGEGTDIKKIIISNILNLKSSFLMVIHSST